MLEDRLASMLAIAGLLVSAGCGGSDADQAFGAQGSTTAGAGGSTTSSSSSATGAGGGGGAATVDRDGDGLDDGVEAAIAADYLPILSIVPGDGCPLGGVVYRVRPHPNDPSLIHVLYDHLFERDCGLNGHVGDDEAFGVTVDPAIAPPLGIVAIKAITHQGQICEQTTECGTCGGLPACTLADAGQGPWPVVFSSDGKHATYARQEACNPVTTCLDTCELNTAVPPIPMVNAGEPEGHLIENLTTEGFITQANGWTEQALFDYNPWDPATDFGGAGNVAGDLDDPSFVSAICP